MGVRAILSRLAAAGPVPVFVTAGIGGADQAAAVLRLEGLRVVESPRSANVLLVVADVPRSLLYPLMVVHDQLSVPRATLWWPSVGGSDGELAEVIPAVERAEPGDPDPLRTAFAGLLDGTRTSEPPALADIEPAAWRGVGPYGQGGTGMTGGVPFGRPMPDWAEDRDGLKLDQAPLRLGPFLPGFPPGLALDVRLQGDVVQELKVDNLFRFERPAPTDDVFDRSLRQPVTVWALELARAGHHLRRAAGALRLAGLGAEGARLLRVAGPLSPDDADLVGRLGDRLVRRRSLRWRLADVGPIHDADAPAGPTARAAGVTIDARVDDPAYEGLGFEPVTHPEGDAWARFRQRLAEAEQALVLAGRAGDGVREAGPTVEGPRGPASGDVCPSSAALLDRLPDLLTGLDWSDAVTVLASLDLDLLEAASASVGQDGP